MNKNTEKNNSVHSAEDSHVEQREAQTELTTPTCSELVSRRKDTELAIQKLFSNWENLSSDEATQRTLDAIRLDLADYFESAGESAQQSGYSLSSSNFPKQDDLSEQARNIRLGGQVLAEHLIRHKNLLVLSQT